MWGNAFNKITTMCRKKVETLSWHIISTKLIDF